MTIIRSESTPVSALDSRYERANQATDTREAIPASDDGLTRVAA